MNAKLTKLLELSERIGKIAPELEWNFEAEDMGYPDSFEEPGQPYMPATIYKEDPSSDRRIIVATLGDLSYKVDSVDDGEYDDGVRYAGDPTDIAEFISRAARDSQALFEGLIEQNNDVYQERDRLVAALSKCFPSHLCRHPEDDKEWERDWMTIVCIHLPAGQATWHIHDSEVPMFAHLQMGSNHWDGHTTELKYKRLAELKVMRSAGDFLRSRISAILPSVDLYCPNCMALLDAIPGPEHWDHVANKPGWQMVTLKCPNASRFQFLSRMRNHTHTTIRLLY